jgi:hypothetical protein
MLLLLRSSSLAMFLGKYVVDSLLSLNALIDLTIFFSLHTQGS